MVFRPTRNSNPFEKPFGIGQRVFGSSLLNGLVAWWKCDEASWSGVAGEVIDSIGTNHGIAVNGATTNSDSKYGRAGNFTRASSQYVNCGSGSSLKLSSTLTLSAWVKPTSVTVDQTICGYWVTSSGTNNAYLLSLRSGYIAFEIQQSNNAFGSLNTTGLTPTAGAWQHIVATADGTTMRVYRNGTVSPTTASYNGTINTSSTTFFAIGRLNFPTWYFGGLIDDVRLYNRALSASEVTDLYNLAS